MSKSPRQRKLELLKRIAASQKLSLKLKQETQINMVQTKMLEAEFDEMKQHLETLTVQRNQIQFRVDEIEAQGNEIEAQGVEIEAQGVELVRADEREVRAGSLAGELSNQEGATLANQEKAQQVLEKAAQAYPNEKNEELESKADNKN